MSLCNKLELGTYTVELCWVLKKYTNMYVTLAHISDNVFDAGII